MGSGIYIAAAGAVAQSNALDVTANNVANASTTAFHGTKVSFHEALTRAKSPDTALVGNQTTSVDGSQGAMTVTGNPLDIALDGDGYFAVDSAQGVRYTRAGALRLGTDGRIENSDGLPVRGVGGTPLVVPQGSATISIAQDGTISTEAGPVGKLELTRFPPNSMQRDGATLMTATARPIAGDPPRVLQATLEGSNVNVVRGVVELVKVSRNYESLMRVIEGFQTIESRAARDLGGPK
ncbi:MAG TPA: flagellar basal-body rod protein FlgF [Kofleriaceae bacterium]|nr:flagellar basal-body rod protein FlgF [Kofleriaceae bacterium]